MDLVDRLIKNTLEYDLNPFMVFDKDAKIVYYNQEAEYLLSYVSSKEIFELALKYAPINYGYKNSYIQYEFDRIRFCAIGVGYEDDEYLSVFLHKEIVRDRVTMKKTNYTKVSIYTILELASNNLPNIMIKKDYDPSIPETYLAVKEFIYFLNRLFKEFKDEKSIGIKVEVKVGKSMLIDEKKYPVCAITFISSKSINSQSELIKLAKDMGVVVVFEKEKVVVEFALVK